MSNKTKKWCILDSEVKEHIEVHATCFLNDRLLQALHLCESKEWQYLNFNFRYCWVQRNEPLPSTCLMRHSLVDQLTKDIKISGKPYAWISLTNNKNAIEVPFVPLYFLKKWELTCVMHSENGNSNEFDEILNKSKKHANTWIEIDAGAAKQRSNKPTIDASIDVPLNYCIQPIGENTCILASLINAMHYMNDTRARDILVENIGKSISHGEYGKHSKTRRGFCAVIMNDFVTGYITKCLPHFDILNDRCIWPTLCILKGTDDGINHAITVVENFIFDGNSDVALPLTRENLDWCCASVDNPSASFDKVFHAYRFVKVKPSSQFLLRGNDKINHAFYTAFRCWTALGDNEALKLLQQVGTNINVSTDILGTIRDMMKNKPLSYRPISIANVNDVMMHGSRDTPVIVLLHSIHTFYYTVICALGGVLFHGDLDMHLSEENLLFICINGSGVPKCRLRLQKGTFLQNTLIKGKVATIYAKNAELMVIFARIKNYSYVCHNQLFILYSSIIMFATARNNIKDEADSEGVM